MTARIARSAWLALLLTSAPGPARAAAPEPEEARLKAVVETLAAPEYQGRKGEGGRKTAAFLIERFRALKLEPLFEGEFTQSIPAREAGQVQGRNVGAMLRGTDPKLRDEWVIVSAHYDHLGVRNGVLYPGADDNATGVAMMLEVARSFVQASEGPKRSVMFIGFDLEEVGLFGSRYFVEHSPVPLAQVSLFLTADMLGRSLGGVCEPYVFVFGSEHVPGLRPWIEEAAVGRPLTIGVLGSDLLILNRSDYGPFRARKVPYLFFSTGENPCYHTPQDTADTVNYPKLEAISRVICGVVRRAAGASSIPKWQSVPDNPLDEAVAIRDVMRRLVEHREELKIGSTQLRLMTNALSALDGIVARGTITPSERTGVVQVARFILASVL